MKNIEIEYKVLLHKDDFLKLEEFLKENDSHTIEQINYYYETDNHLLKTKGLSLRIRHLVSENKYLVTLKEKILDGHIEYEQYLNSLSLSEINDEITNVLIANGCTLNDLKQMAFLKTIRKEYHFDNKLLCLDHNFYYQKEDYEVECEATSLKEAQDFLINLLESNKIDFQKSLNSKQQRAMNTKG